MAPSPLEDAWDAALDAPGAEEPWRVLADMLSAEGDPRGELLQLELDAERGPLKGLAKGRLTELRRSVVSRLVPPGVDPAGAVLWRTVLVECQLRATSQVPTAHPGWATVRHLRYQVEPLAPSVHDWARTPLAGARLRRLEVLSGVEQECLLVLTKAPPKPRLRRLRLLGDLGRDPRAAPLDLAPYWAELLPAHPALREVHLGYSGSHAATQRRLDSLVRADLERVLVEAGPSELIALHEWRVTARPRFTFVAELRDPTLGASVELGEAELVLRAAKGELARAEASVRSNWPAHRPMPPLRTAP